MNRRRQSFGMLQHSQVVALNLFRDLRFAVRILLKTPGLSFIAIVALAIGIGLTSTMFAMVHGAILKGLPFDKADQLMNAVLLRPATGSTQLVTIHDLADWRERQTSFEALAAWIPRRSILTMPDGNRERLDSAFVSSNLFALLRVRPLLGRDFTAIDELASAEPVLMLSHGLWQNRFRADPNIVGDTVVVQGVAHKIIGVMPPEFAFPIRQELWIPLHTLDRDFERGEGQRFFAFGRLKEGVTEDEAQAELSTIARAVASEYPETNRGLDVKLGPYINEVVGERILNLNFTMLAAVFGVLLIACANVANLQLARAVLRTQEVAARFALGASRARVFSQLLAESLVLSVLGALGGLVIAQTRIAQFNEALQSAPTVPFWLKVELDWQVVGFVIGLILLATLSSGCLPAFQASRTDLNEILKTESRTSSNMRLGKFSNSLVVGEIALSCSLLVGTGLMIKSVLQLEDLSRGFFSENVLIGRVSLTEPEHPDDASRLQFFTEILRRLDGAPGVEAVALTSHFPGLGSGGTSFEIEGKVAELGAERRFTRQASISPAFFETFGVELVDGRAFRPSDDHSSFPVAIVNHSFATRYFPGESPLGRRLRQANDGSWLTIVGVAPDLALNQRRPSSGMIGEDSAGLYLPLSQNPVRSLGIAVRTTSAPLTSAAMLREMVQSTATGVPLDRINSLDGAIRDLNIYYTLVSEYFLIFGFSALFLASIGLYGVTSFSVNRRARELGIRMAMGAEPRRLLTMILKQGLSKLGLGLILGLGLAFIVAGTLRMALYEVEPFDPFVFITIVATLLIVGTLACLLPARRASLVDPIAALRDE